MNYYEQTVYDGKWKRFTYNCCDFYKEVDNPDEWLDCPNCGKKPLIWTSNNGRCTGCGCGKGKYDHFAVFAESIMSVIKRNNGSTMEYDSDELRKNWNHWVETGEFKFVKGNGRW